MSKIIVYIATSLDGYIARKNGDIDWLEEDPSYDFYEKFLKDIDIIIMGAKSYGKIQSFDIKWPYPKQTTYVFTHSKTQKDTENIRFISQDIESFIKNLSIKKEKNIWLLGGSNLISQFLEKKLVDELIIGTQPKILGEGIPLFLEGSEKRLELLDVKSYEKGMVQIHYKIRK